MNFSYISSIRLVKDNESLNMNAIQHPIKISISISTQLGVCPLLDDLPVMNDYDSIQFFNFLQSVSYVEGCLSSHDPLQGLLNF